MRCHQGYVDIGLIPEGSWDIRIEEMAEAGNFLALRGDGPNKYYLNGGWTIQWNGEYKAAGAVFTYERTGHRENLTSPGPTMEPLWIQVGLIIKFNVLFFLFVCFSDSCQYRWSCIKTVQLILMLLLFRRSIQPFSMFNIFKYTTIFFKLIFHIKFNRTH